MNTTESINRSGTSCNKHNLSELTLEELWQLFPIILTEYNPVWKDWYNKEALTLKELLPENVIIHHVGSTAIEGIWAKPIVDILIEAELADFPVIHELLLANGYRNMYTKEQRRGYNKGYTEQGFAEKVFHLHLRTFGDHDELYFRDYLNAHSDAAKQYEELKLSLWKKYEHDRDGYTAAKEEFVKKYTIKNDM
ncbi:MAG: GrpB family protein [bacterium]|nr:GrpB family protein [bacterium]